MDANRFQKCNFSTFYEEKRGPRKYDIAELPKHGISTTSQDLDSSYLYDDEKFHNFSQGNILCNNVADKIESLVNSQIRLKYDQSD